MHSIPQQSSADKTLGLRPSVFPMEGPHTLPAPVSRSARDVRGSAKQSLSVAVESAERPSKIRSLQNKPD